ncbi:MAG: hypothetical protein CMN79_04895 [Spirochaetales bacterium]|nr:hypothetical protein [Spirochaetales bacterium]
MSESIRCLLVHQGEPENYGMIYVAGELKRLGVSIKWVNGDFEQFPLQVATEFNPDYVLFSPKTITFSRALAHVKTLKAAISNVKCVIGGHHVSAVPEDAENELIDYAVLGPVYGTLEKIFSGNCPKILQGRQVEVKGLIPDREEYYRDIPYITQQPRRYIMSHFGCPFKCTYCGAARLQETYGAKEYKKMFLARRPPQALIEESRIFLKYQPREVFLVDDDCMQGKDAEEWLGEFAALWKEEIDLPITAYVSPLSLSRASDSLMQVVGSIFPVINMGIQSFSEETLKIYNRSFQTEEMVRNAVGRLRDFGIRGRLELIFGAPCDDPVEEALYSLKKMQEIAPDFYCTAYALLVFPGTALQRYLKEEGIPFSDLASHPIHSGYTSVQFDADTMEKIRKLTKLSHLYVSSNVDISFMRALLEMDMPDKAAHAISKANYFLSQKYKYGQEGEDRAEERLKYMRFLY